MPSLLLKRFPNLSTPPNSQILTLPNAQTPYAFTTEPPLGCSTWPVKYGASSEARNT
jgi:hypothetical protein